MAGRTTRAGQRWPDQDLDHGHGFALVRASGQGFNFDLANHSRRGVKILIFVVSKIRMETVKVYPPPYYLRTQKKGEPVGFRAKEVNF